MKKQVFASFCSLTAIACALWLFLYTVVNDLMQTPFDGGDIMWELKLFGPMVVFVFCCLGYVRTRRAMDKEKLMLARFKQEAFNSIFIVQVSEITARALLGLIPEGKLSKERCGDELIIVLNELRFTYHRFYRDGGQRNRVATSMLTLLERLDCDMPHVSFGKK